MISQYNKGKQGNVAEYNANNAWLYNGNNGCLNNNNKNNTNSVRPTLDSHYVKGSLEGAVVPLAAWYPVYRTCRRHCGRKHLHLRFRYGWMVLRLINTAADVAMFEYIPGMAVCFMIERPRLRVRCMGRKANGNRAYMFANVEHFMQSANSYLGLLGWCNTERLRAEIVEDMKADGFGRLLSFPDGNRKTNIKPPYTRAAHYKRLNKKRKKSLKLWICKA